MTLVNLTAEETVLGGFAAVSSGVVTATYWAGQAPYTTVEGADVRFPAEIRVQIRDGQPADPVELVPTRGVCCVRWKISDLRSGRSLSRYTEIPDVGPVDFGDLPVVDPASFAPVVPVPSLVETINAQVAAYMAEHPGVSPEDVAAAVEAWLIENPLEGVTQAQLDAAVAGLARSADLAEVATSGAYTDLDGLPVLDFAPTAHTHAQSDVDGLTVALGSKVGTDDPRLSDARTPVAHTHEIGDVTGLEDALANAGGGGVASTGWIEQPVPAETLGTSTIQWFIRRDASVVFLKARVNGTPAGTSLGTIPVGYRMTAAVGDWLSSDTAFPMVRGGTTNVVNAVRVQYGNQVSILAQSTVNGLCMVSWPTDDPMPA